MTRKDFQLIASTIAKMKSSDDHLYIADMFATDLASTNQLFDRKRFLEACGVEQ